MENHNELFWLTQYFEEPVSHIVLTDTVQRGARWSNWNVFYLEGIFRLPKFWFVGFYHSSNQSVSNTSVLKQLPGGGAVYKRTIFKSSFIHYSFPLLMRNFKSYLGRCKGKELEKEMATHSSVLAWRIPGTGEPGGLLSVRSHRVGHDWSDLAAEEKSSKECIKM